MVEKEGKFTGKIKIVIENCGKVTNRLFEEENQIVSLLRSIME